jgi:hypothetical protein
LDSASLRAQPSYAHGIFARLAIHRGVTFMTTLSRLILAACCALLVVPAISGAEQLPRVAKQVAKTYGLDSFGQVEAIRYTFTIPGLVPARTWEWRPKTDTVSYEGKDKDGKPMKVTYQRAQLDGQSDAVKNQIDPGFVNDQYWLLLPLHVVWDGATVTDEGMQELPLGKTSAQKIAVKYSSGGYSPGDTWELYVGADKRVEEIAYHRAVPAPGLPNLVLATWSGYKKAGPLLISTEHQGTADGHPFQLTFTDVSVKVKGSKNWIHAK